MKVRNEAANPELAAIEVRGMNRSAFLVRGAIATGGLYGAGAVSSFVSTAFGQADNSDVEILNFALTLEYLEAAFYERALQDLDLSGEAKQLAQLLGDHENEHVDTLTATIQDLGGQPVEAPKVKFPLKDEKSFLELSQTFEDTGVAAYDGAAPQIKSKDILAAAGSIAQVEARHAAAIRFLRGNNPTRGAFEPTLEKDQVLKMVQPFIQS